MTFPLPIYDADLQETRGIPAVAHEFVAQMKATDDLILSSPEYNKCNCRYFEEFY